MSSVTQLIQHNRDALVRNAQTLSKLLAEQEEQSQMFLQLHKKQMILLQSQSNTDTPHLDVW